MCYTYTYICAHECAAHVCTYIPIPDLHILLQTVLNHQIMSTRPVHE